MRVSYFTSVEKVKGSIDIDDLVASLGLLALRELNNLARGGQEVRDLGIGFALGSTSGEGANLGGVNRRDGGGTDRATTLVVILGHQQHATNELSGGDVIGTLALSGGIKMTKERPYQHVNSFFFLLLLQIHTGEVGRIAARLAFSLPVAASILDDLVAIRAVGHGGDVVSVHAEVTVVLVHVLKRSQVRSVGDDLIDPLAGSNSSVSTARRETRRSV